MIVVEHILRDIIAQFPTIKVNGNDYTTKFHWGDKKELNSYLSLVKDDSYPLVFLIQNPETHTQQNTIVEKQCNFILAWPEPEKDLLNNERYENSFDIVLNPLLDYLIQGLDNSGVTRFTGTEKEVFKRPNYSETGSKSKNGSVYLWDVITLSDKIEFNKSCIDKITWIKKKTK